MSEQINLFDNIKEIRFDGEVYDPEKDDIRLAGQLLRVWNAMLGSGWMTVDEIHAITGDKHNSIQAQIRHLRKDRFGDHKTPKRRRYGEDSATWEYKLFPNPQLKLVDLNGRLTKRL